MSDKYTPDTTLTRLSYVAMAVEGGTSHEEARAEFNRWMNRALSWAARDALLRAADDLDGADAHDELSRTTRWSDGSVADAVENSGPITDWLRARAAEVTQ